MLHRPGVIVFGCVAWGGERGLCVFLIVGTQRPNQQSEAHVTRYALVTGGHDPCESVWKDPEVRPGGGEGFPTGPSLFV